MMDKIFPGIIVSGLAVLLGAINFLLWQVLWRNDKKKTAGKNPDAEIKAVISGIEDIKKRMVAENEKVSKIEDQLWGVMDKLKEIDNKQENIKKIVAASKTSRESNEYLDTLKAWGKKGHDIARKYMESGSEQPEDGLYAVTKLDDILKAIEDEIAKISSKNN